MIVEKDIEILNIIQNNSKASYPMIGKQVGLTPSAVFERIRKLEAKGIIQSYNTKLSHRAVGLGVLAFVFLKVEIGTAETDIDQSIADIDEIQEVHHVSGEDCYLLKVWACDNDDLGRLLLEKVHSIKGVRATRTTIVLKTVKDSPLIPLRRDSKGNST
ncbi:MAG: Lrp/AsnC family transcriptional regulator [Deltaproteobacteria bacterium]|nr:Lrp/AsnC family transcriptional regulator [Deltaproteobacteria bacterium]